MAEDTHIIAERIRKLPDDTLVKIFNLALLTIKNELDKFQEMLRDLSLIAYKMERENIGVKDSVSLELQKGKDFIEP
jgi:hypothetical protein